MPRLHFRYLSVTGQWYANQTSYMYRQAMLITATCCTCLNLFLKVPSYDELLNKSSDMPFH